MPRELSTGLVIAGAYADKLRRTLFAQLRDIVKQNKEFAKEIARASAEVNRMLFYILVDKLKADKGDVVRIRVQYDVEADKIKWYYDTLRIEFFRRVPDEEVEKIVKETIKERLEEVKEQYAEVAAVKEEKREEVKEVEEKKEEVKEEISIPEKPEIDVKSLVTDVIPIGETMDGGLILELKGPNEENIGIASIEQRAGTYVAEAIVLPKPREAYKMYVKLSGTLEDYKEEPKKLIDELGKSKPVKLSVKEAREILKAKMESIV